MKKTRLVQEFLDRKRNAQIKVKVNHIESVVAGLIDSNPQWGFSNVFEMERSIGLPASASCPLVRWTARQPHGPGNSVWCFPDLFPALPSLVAANREGRPGFPWPFDEWARTLGLVAEAERRFRKAVFYWPHSDRQDPSWVNRAFSQEFQQSLMCDVDPYRPYANSKEFEECL